MAADSTVMEGVAGAAVEASALARHRRSHPGNVTLFANIRLLFSLIVSLATIDSHKPMAAVPNQAQGA
jgi:hypothetical protein